MPKGSYLDACKFFIMICRPVILLLLFATLLSSCNGGAQSDDGTEMINSDSFVANVKVLSSNAFMGRKPFTAGETKTVDFMQSKFREYGLEPGNGGSYLQDVPLVNIATMAAPAMKVESAKGSFDLKGYDDYAVWTDRTDSMETLDKTEVVFAGYGVVAPEYGWNDYEGVDVKGKVVMVLVNDPGFYANDSTLFKGKTMTYYGRWTYKYEEAARQGAKACLIVHTDAGASYPFRVVQNNHNTSRLVLENSTGEYKCPFTGWVTSASAKKILDAAGTDTTLFAKADKKGFKAVPLNVKLTTNMKVETTYNKSHNVIAKITGSKYPDEYIIYTAHWDHLGIGKPDEKGDSIYNGALDNASGSAALLELARVFKNLKTRPERTIIFLSVTAEEQGLLGSAYYAQHPIYPVEKTVANINMDGINLMGKTRDVSITGQGQNEVEDIYIKQAQLKTMYVSPQEHPEAGGYYRSDHFNFAKVGVPALSAHSGLDLEGKGREAGKKLSDEYTEKHYHRPSDEYNADAWHSDGILQELQLYFLTGKELAFKHAWPDWKEGSEFRALRDKTKTSRK